LSASSVRREEGLKTIEMEFGDEDLGIQEDYEEDDDVYRKMELAGNLKKEPSKFTLRPISGRVQGPEEFFSTFSKYTNFAELENQYEELFDRNERTYAATYPKFGDLSYYTPIQRIGSFMQYPAKLKKEHLDEIISLLQTSIIIHVFE